MGIAFSYGKRMKITTVSKAFHTELILLVEMISIKFKFTSK